MYFTIGTGSPSSPALPPLSAEAWAAYQRLQEQALALAPISPGVDAASRAVTTAYAFALAGGNDAAWTAFVAAAAALAPHSDYFAQIARENEDLLLAEAPALV